MKTKILIAIILALFLLALMFPLQKAENKEACARYFGWGSDPDGSAHCMSEEAALPGNVGGVEPQGPLTVTAGQLVTFAINWSEWHDGPTDWAIYIGPISGNISYPPYNVPYPQLVDTTLLANWTNDITVFGNPPTVTGPYVDNASYVALGILPNYNPRMLPNLNSAPYEAAQAFVVVKNTVTITIPTSLAGTYTIRLIATSSHGEIPPPPDPNDERVLGNPLITLWGWPPEWDPNGYPWGEFVDMTVVVSAREPRTWTVDDDEPADFTRIQDAIDSSLFVAGDTIFVCNGTYYENVVVDKEMSLIGENKSIAIIDGVGGGGTVVTVTANNVVMNGFTIQNGMETGIWLYSSNNSVVSNNIVTNNDQVGSIGIYLYPSSNNNTISNNTVSSNWEGIVVESDSSNNTIYANDVFSNEMEGIQIHGGFNNTISGNSIWNNADGIYLEEGSNNTLSGNNSSSNNRAGTYLEVSEYNNISGNIFSNNSGSGIVLQGDNNIISGNNISLNPSGIYVVEVYSNNKIFHNNFVNNTLQVNFTDPSAANIWDDGYFSGGNYWSDYVGEDLYWGPYQNLTGSDGIGDALYVINENNRDNYPLMSPYEYWRDPILGDINKDMKVDSKDLSQLAAAYGSTPGNPNWNPYCDFNSDNKVDASDLLNLSRNWKN